MILVWVDLMVVNQWYYDDLFGYSPTGIVCCSSEFSYHRRVPTIAADNCCQRVIRYGVY